MGMEARDRGRSGGFVAAIGAPHLPVRWDVIVFLRCRRTAATSSTPPSTSYRKMNPMLKTFLNDEAGLETVEYAIIAGMIVAGTVAVVVAIGGWVNGQFTGLQTDLGA